MLALSGFAVAGTKNGVSFETKYTMALDPVKEKITAFNTRNGILFFLQGLATLTLEGKLKGSTLTVKVPPFPVPGNPKGAVLTKFDLNVKAIRMVYATTPSTCKRRWTVAATFNYPNVSSIKNIKSSSTCKASKRRSR